MGGASFSLRFVGQKHVWTYDASPLTTMFIHLTMCWLIGDKTVLTKLTFILMIRLRQNKAVGTMKSKGFSLVGGLTFIKRYNENVKMRVTWRLAMFPSKYLKLLVQGITFQGTKRFLQSCDPQRIGKMNPLTWSKDWCTTVQQHQSPPLLACKSSPSPPKSLIGGPPSTSGRHPIHDVIVENELCWDCISI